MLGLTACGTGVGHGEETAPEEAGDTGDSAAAPPGPWTVEVRVTVDGVAEADVAVMQAGTESVVFTDELGVATLQVDPEVPGDVWVAAAAEGAWNAGAEVTGPGSVDVALLRYDETDNPDYAFMNPGVDATADTNSGECSHCHLTIHRGWAVSPHRNAASEPSVHAVYQGVDLALGEAACAARGGDWSPAVTPGTGVAVDACHVATGVVDATGGSGACADCHAPGIGGASLSGHDLLEATGIAYDFGVHCDVCHKVVAVEPLGEAGVAGRLQLLRPLDPSPSRLLGIWHPLTFGPYIDVLNPLMGASFTEVLHEASFCSGCHELQQPVLVSEEGIDLARWPTGRLPIQTTWSEWEAGPMNPAAPCQSCHMPPAPGAGNSADLGNEFPTLIPGVAAGWLRPPGSVREHTWVGPRTVESGMLELAAFLEVDAEVLDGELIASVTTTNVGPGHAIPTGEPLRNLVLRVEATCDGVALAPSGGDVVPDFGGAVATRSAPEALDVFSDASVGDRVRFATTAGMVDYHGHGSFGDGTFDATEKGFPKLEFVGEAEVLAVGTDGTLTLDHPEFVSSADAAFLIPAAAADALAGLPGFGFAKVLVGADGERMVPHHLAVDVASDNRILATESFTTSHRFVVTCADPEVHATLLYRAYPWAQAQRYGWTLEDRVMAEVSR